MTDYVVTFDAGQKLPNGRPADELFVTMEAADRTDLSYKLWDMFGGHRGEVFDTDNARDAMRGRREVIPVSGDMQWFDVERCPTCDARVIRTMRVPNLRTTFVDAACTADGTVVLSTGDHGVLARVLTTAARFGRHNLHAVHNCRKRASSNPKSVHS